MVVTLTLFILILLFIGGYHIGQNGRTLLARKWKPSWNDGVFIFLIVKGVSTPFLVWNALLHQIARRMGVKENTLENRRFFDIYTATFFILLVASYMLATQSSLWLNIATILAGFRLYDLYCTISLLHVALPYKTDAPHRAVANTIWHYIEATVAFSILYLYAADADSDCFKSHLYEDCLTPIYFSFSMISTLGYDGIWPSKGMGKTLVIAEVLFGIFLFIVVLQRVFMAQPREKPRRSHFVRQPTPPDKFDIENWQNRGL